MASRNDLLCSHILLAEFDIDEGSILRHEYPAPTGTDTHLLAELMLPDGVHARSEDWTVFYLNRGPNVDTKKRQSYETMTKTPALLHVINLVRTKMDNTVRRYVFLKAFVTISIFAHVHFISSRGAIVKAMAVASPLPFIQIFKVFSRGSKT